MSKQFTPYELSIARRNAAVDYVLHGAEASLLNPKGELATYQAGLEEKLVDAIKALQDKQDFSGYSSTQLVPIAIEHLDALYTRGKATARKIKLGLTDEHGAQMTWYPELSKTELEKLCTELTREALIKGHEDTAHKDATAIVNKAMVGGYDHENTAQVCSALRNEINSLLQNAEDSIQKNQKWKIEHGLIYDAALADEGSNQVPMTISNLLKIKHKLLAETGKAKEKTYIEELREIVLQNNPRLDAIKKIELPHEDATDSYASGGALPALIAPGKIKGEFAKIALDGLDVEALETETLDGKGGLRAEKKDARDVARVNAAGAESYQESNLNARINHFIKAKAGKLDVTVFDLREAYQLDTNLPHIVRFRIHKELADEFEQENTLQAAEESYKKKYRETYYENLQNTWGERKAESFVIAKALENSRLDKLYLQNKAWWTEQGVHQAKGFSLSCGTTMAGAVLILAMSMLPSAALFPLVLLSVYFVHKVTRANFWLTNGYVATLFNEFFCDRENAGKTWRKLLSDLFSFRKINPLTDTNPFNRNGIRLSLFLAAVTGIVWTIFTYVATEVLVKNVGKDFTKFDEQYIQAANFSLLNSQVLVGLLGIALIGRGLFDLYTGLRSGDKLKTARGALLTASAVVFAAMPSLMLPALPIVVAGLMAAYTFPTIWAIFHAFTKKHFEKKKTDANSYEKLFKKFDNIYTINGYEGTKKSYKAVVAVFFVIGFLLSLMAAPYIANALPFSADFSAMTAAICVIFSGLSAFAAKFLFPKTAAQADSGILRKAFYIMAAAALWGALATVLASAPGTQEMLIGWFGVGKLTATIISYVFTAGIGLISAAIFYEGSTRGAISAIFGQKGNFTQAKGVSHDAVGLHEPPAGDEPKPETTFDKFDAWCTRFFSPLVALWNKISPFATKNISDRARMQNVGENALLNSFYPAAGGNMAFDMSSNVANYALAGVSVTGGTAASAMPNIHSGVNASPDEHKNLALAEKMHTSAARSYLGALAHNFDEYAEARAHEATSGTASCLTSHYQSLGGYVFGHDAATKVSAAKKARDLLNTLNESVDPSSINVSSAKAAETYSDKSTENGVVFSYAECRAMKNSGLGVIFDDAMKHPQFAAKMRSAGIV